MKNIVYLIFALSLLFVAACVDDDTNYGYPPEEEIKGNEIVIDTTGTDRRVFWQTWQNDSVYEYEPKVHYAHPERLRYAWFVLPHPYSGVQEGNGYVYPAADTICRSLKLEYTCNLTPGWHTLYLQVEDSVLGIKSYFSPSNYFTVGQTGSLNMVFCLETNADGVVDIDAFGTSECLIYSVGHEKNLWTSKYPDDPIVGTPVTMECSNASSYNNAWYYIATDKEIRRVSPSGFKTMDKNGDLFYQMPERINPQAFMNANTSDFMINDGKLYCLYNPTEADRKFPAAIPGDYNLAPFLASDTKTSWGHTEGAIDAHQIVYDYSANCIRPYFSRQSALGFFGPILSADSPFNYNSMPVGAQLLHCAVTNGGETLLLTKEGGVVYANIACFYNVVDNGNLARRRVSLAGCENIADAEHFATTNAGSVIYYSYKNKIYSYAYGSGRTSANLLEEFSADEQITALGTLKTGGFPTGGYVVWIATWNETAKNGTVYQAYVDPMSGDLSSNPYWAPELGVKKVDDGFGRIYCFCQPK